MFLLILHSAKKVASQGPARQSLEGRGEAEPSTAWQGLARHGKIFHCLGVKTQAIFFRPGKARQGWAWCGVAWPSKARQGKVFHCLSVKAQTIFVRRSTARHSGARQSEAWHSNMESARHGHTGQGTARLSAELFHAFQWFNSKRMLKNFGVARRGQAVRGEAEYGKAWLGEAKRDMAWHGLI